MAKRRVHRPQGTSTVSRGGSARRRGSTPRPQPVVASGPGLRARFERASAPWLVRMSALPAFLIPVLLAVVLFAGLVVPFWWGGLLLLPIALFLGWLAAISWPSLSPGSRALRVLVSLGMGALGVVKVVQGL